MRLLLFTILLCLFASKNYALVAKNYTHYTTKKLTQERPEDRTEPIPIKKNLTGTFAVTSNYVYHGISQTTNTPAVQGGLTYTYDNGIYLNIWGSNISFVGTHASAEIDTIIGYTNSYKNLTYYLSINRYHYVRATNFNYNEFIAFFYYKMFDLEVDYSPNMNNTHTPGSYVGLGAHYTLPPKYIWGLRDFMLNGRFGHSNLSRAAGNSYNDYTFYITKKILAYTLTLQWSSTNGRSLYPQQYTRNLYLAMVSVDF